jgi:opacity protein-like surface antigen
MKTLLLGVVLLLPAVASATERGYLEVGGGGALPVADGTYRDEFGAGPSLWAAAVLNPRNPPTYAWMAPFAVEMSFDWTFIGEDRGGEVETLSVDFNRYRLLLAGRYHRTIRDGLIAFARAGAGVEILAWDQRGKIGGIQTSDSDAHLGVALELGAGVRYRMGAIDLGGQLALPMALHQHETYGQGIEVDHFGIDLAARFTVGIVY